MNKLETEIKDFIINNDINDYEIKDIAKRFYVSRSLVYKVLNKMGYRSLSSVKYEKNINKMIYDIYSSKYEVEENKYIDELVNNVIRMKLVLIVYTPEAEIAAKYFELQLKNIGIVSVIIDENTELEAYQYLSEIAQMPIYISNTGKDTKRYDELMKLFSDYIVISRVNSKLAQTAEKCIYFDNLVTKFSDKFECENTALLIMQLQYILDKIRRCNQSKR
ncbi:MAG: hypothetical protein ACK5LC_01510 [Coprobacillaceae bacterium]